MQTQTPTGSVSDVCGGWFHRAYLPKHAGQRTLPPVYQWIATCAPSYTHTWTHVITVTFAFTGNSTDPPGSSFTGIFTTSSYCDPAHTCLYGGLQAPVSETAK
jgi:hypothetical protein